MSGRDFLDTNVLVYAFDQDEPDKRSVAQDLLKTSLLEGSGMLSGQVVGEFYVAVTRRIASPMSPGQAQRAVDNFLRLPVVPVDGALARRGMEASERYQLAYWDGLIVAAAERAGCDRILSEDLSAGQAYFGVRVDNPFADEGHPPDTPPAMPGPAASAPAGP